MITNRIAELRSKRGKHGITKAQLARKIGVSRSYITKLERHQLTASAEMMFKLADYLECPIEDIFRYEPDRSRQG